MRLVKKFKDSGKTPTKEEYIKLMSEAKRLLAHKNMLEVEKDQSKAVVPVLTNAGYRLVSKKEFDENNDKKLQINKDIEELHRKASEDVYNKYKNFENTAFNLARERLGIYQIFDQNQMGVPDSYDTPYERMTLADRDLQVLEHYSKIDSLWNSEEAKVRSKELHDLNEAKLLKLLEAGIFIPGLACISNVLAPYGIRNIVSNMLFRDNADKLGFKPIPITEAEPGDVYSSISHGMMIDGTENGKLLVNQSHGSGPLAFHDDAFADTIDGLSNKEKLNSNTFQAWRFVGTPQDSLNWAKEWHQKYATKK